MKIKTIKRTKLYKEILTQINQLIAKGEIKSGDVLPPERELSERFKVSRASVREAISALEHQGIIERYPGIGTIVVGNSMDMVVQTFVNSFTKERNDLEEIFEMRELLEPKVAHLAAQKVSVQDIKRMQETLKRVESSDFDLSDSIQVDTDFHNQIASATKNSVIIGLISAISKTLAKTREEYLQSPQRMQKSILAHNEILTAIVNHNPYDAEHAMYKHISEVHHEIAIVFKKNDDAKKNTAFSR